MALAPKQNEEEFEEDDIIIEVDDDTPDVDKGRDIADDDTSEDKDGEADDDELKNYSQEAQRRIRILTKKKHDERRAKETALRVQNEAINTARQVLSENERLKAQLRSTATVAVGAHKSQAETELADLKGKMADAIDAADGKTVADLAEKIADAKTRLTGATQAETRLKESSEDDQNKDGTVQDEQNNPENWPKARQKWAKKNADWFGKDDEMTALAYGVHGKIVREGEVDVDSPEYFELIDKRMRKVFPDKFKKTEDDDDDFDFGEEDEKSKKKVGRKAASKASDFGGGSVLNSSVNSKGKKVYKITESQRRMCKNLGISEKDYVKQVIAKERDND